MPNLKTHCEISKKRTGNEHRELHKWMDEATEYLGHNHRLERHFFTSEYKNFIENKWGPKAVVEWLFHIALDNMETAHKFAYKAYQRAFREVHVKFGKHEISGCSFDKENKTTEWKRS